MGAKGAKFERCVRSVKKSAKKSRRAVNPWAVCHAAVGRDPSADYVLLHENAHVPVSRPYPLRKYAIHEAEELSHSVGTVAVVERRGKHTTTLGWATNGRFSTGPRGRRDPKKPSAKAWGIVRFVNREMPLPSTFVLKFGLPKSSADYILGLAGGMFGPGGRGEEAYARAVDAELARLAKARSSRDPSKGRPPPGWHLTNAHVGDARHYGSPDYPGVIYRSVSPRYDDDHGYFFHEGSDKTFEAPEAAHAHYLAHEARGTARARKNAAAKQAKLAAKEAKLEAKWLQTHKAVRDPKRATFRTAHGLNRDPGSKATRKRSVLHMLETFGNVLVALRRAGQTAHAKSKEVEIHALIQEAYREGYGREAASLIQRIERAKR